jgi:hypothetical protein
LFPTPRHIEKIADLDRGGSNVLVHCGNRLN